MGLEEASAMVGIPGANAVVQAAFGERVHFPQPIEVAGNLPVAKHFHDPAQLPVGGGVEVVFDGAFGERGAEGDVAGFIHGAAEFQFAQSGLELREKMRKRLGIVPDMRAGTVAAARIGETTFPTPDIAIFQTRSTVGDLRMAKLAETASRT